MIGHLQCVVLDCPDALALAGFYQALVGGEVNRPDRRWSLDEHRRPSTPTSVWSSLFRESTTITRPSGRTPPGHSSFTSTST